MQKRIADVVIIGAGTAGMNAFHRLKAAGKQVILIDRGPLGTSCARVGCMPSKAVLHAAKRWKTARELPAGALLSAEGITALWAHARQTRDMLVQGAANRARQAAGDSLVMGEATFVATDTVVVDGQPIQAQAFIVATGSRPVVPAAFAGVSEHVLTTDTLFELEVLPRSVGVVGLGAVGLELGLALSRLDVDVVAADQQARLANIQDPDVLARTIERFQGELPMWLGSTVTVQAQGHGVLMQAGEQQALVDKLLVVAGRTPNTEALNLAAAGVAVDAAGRVHIDPSSMRASEAPIFFAGDVQPDRPLMHEAADEGQLAADAVLAHLAGQTWLPKARTVPLSIIFSDPDVCRVGMDYDMAMAQGAVIGSAQGSGNGRSRILGETGHLLRLYVARETGVLLGASMLLTHGESLAHLLAWAVQTGQTVQSLLALPYYHPTMEEMLQSALKSALAEL